MMGNGWITLRDIFSELKQNKMLDGLTMEMLVGYAVAYQRRWDCSDLFETKAAVIETSDYRAQMPCDYYKLIAARDFGTKIMYRAATNVFHGLETPKTHEFTFKMQGSTMVSSHESRPVEILYTAFHTDEDGMPMVLDNQVYIDALKAYVKEKIYSDLFDEGKINVNSLAKAQQDYCFEAKMLQVEFNKVTPEEARSIVEAQCKMYVADGWDEGLFGFGDKTPFKFY